MVLRAGCRELPVSGSQFQAFWDLMDGTEVLATYVDGRPAVLSKRFGAGRAVISGVNLGLSYSTRQGVGDDFVREGADGAVGDARQLVLDTSRQAGVRFDVSTPPDVRASLLSTPDGRHVLIAINMADEPEWRRPSACRCPRCRRPSRYSTMGRRWRYTQDWCRCSSGHTKSKALMLG